MKTNTTKTFAFLLATGKGNAAGNNKKWQIRDGVAIAGCTGRQQRESRNTGGDLFGTDKGYFC